MSKTVRFTQAKPVSLGGVLKTPMAILHQWETWLLDKSPHYSSKLFFIVSALELIFSFSQCLFNHSPFLLFSFSLSYSPLFYSFFWLPVITSQINYKSLFLGGGNQVKTHSLKRSLRLYYFSHNFN